jgi:hypothetical protein
VLKGLESLENRSVLQDYSTGLLQAIINNLWSTLLELCVLAHRYMVVHCLLDLWHTILLQYPLPIALSSAPT